MAPGKPTEATEIVLDAVHRVLPGARLASGPTCEGMESQVLAVEAEGQGWIVRVNASAKGFEKDRYAAKHFATPTLPVPAVLHIDRLSTGRFFCISDRLPGTTLQESPAAVLESMAPSVDAILRNIHATDISGTKGFGPWDTQGNGTHPSWRAWVLEVLDRDPAVWKQMRASLGGRQVDMARDALRDLVIRCPEERCLLHADFGSNNVLTDGTSITGVVDWEESAYGDPLFDVSGCFYWRTWLECMEIQARHYEETLNLDEGLKGRLCCYCLRVGVAEAYGASLREDEEFAAWALARCLRVLDEL